MTTRVSRKRKKHPSVDLNEEEDMISILPNEILHRILSSLPTIQVVKTSILSTRWRNLWKSHPFIQFSKLPLGDKSKILNGVDHILSLRDSNASNIKKLAMECTHDVNLNILHQCIVSSVNQRVEEVDVMVWRSSTSDEIELNPSIFTSGVVRVFKFAIFNNTCMVRFPCSIANATHLRFLKLFGITLPFGDSNQELHLICPNLEDLIIKDCDQSHLKVLGIATPQLSHLVMFNSSLANVRDCKLEIHTPKLSSFRYNGHSYLDYSFMENYPFLDSVDVTFDSMKLNDSIIKLLNIFSNAKKFTLKGIVGGFSRQM